VRVVPATPRKVAVPADKGCWCNDPPRSTIRTERPDQRCEQRTIGPIQRRTARRPTEHRELVAQHNQLSLATSAIAATEPKTEDRAEGEVGEAKQHRQILADRAQ
jgi:hypothetical protein